MRIGIIGSDERAVAIGRLLRSGGHDVTVGDPNTGKAERAAMRLGTQAELPYQQAMHSDLLLLAMPREEIDQAVTAVGSGAEAVIVDATDGKAAPGSHNGAQTLSHKLDTHRLVRALINLAQPGTNVPICGDDPQAKALVEKALRECGCLATDRGPLVNAPQLEPRIAA